MNYPSRTVAETAFAQRIALGIALLGAVLCLWNFAGGRSAWFDESGVGLNITALTFRQLLLKPQLDQMAPVGWMIVERWFYDLTANINFGLRIVSLLGGLALSWSVWKVASATGSALAGALALALVALNGAFVQYAVMIKPYILDALFTTMVIAAGVEVIRARFSTGALAMLLVAGIVAVLFSFAAIFALASTGLLLFLSAAAERRYRVAAALAAIGSVWLATFAAIYLLVYKAQSATISAMTGTYWPRAFGPVPTDLAGLIWYPRALLALATYVFGVAGPLVLLYAVAGAVFVWRRRPVFAAMLVGPIPFALIASALHAYPFFERLQYGTATLFAILAGAGVVWSGEWLRDRPKARVAVIALGAAVLAAHPIERSVARAAQRPPWAWEETEPGLRTIAENRRPPDLIVIGQWTEEPFLLYAPKFALLGRYRPVWADLQPAQCAVWSVTDVAPGQRIWLMISHKDDPGFSEILRELARDGTVRTVRADPGATLYEAALAHPVARGDLATDCRHKPWPRERRFLDGVARARGLQPDLGALAE